MAIPITTRAAGGRRYYHIFSRLGFAKNVSGSAAAGVVGWAAAAAAAACWCDEERTSSSFFILPRCSRRFSFFW